MINLSNRFVNSFIHPQLKVDKSQYEKAIVSVLAFVIILGMGLLYNFFYWSKGVFWGEKSFHNYLGVSLGIIGLIIIKRTGNASLAMALGALVGLYLITASVYLSGGINSNDVFWYAVLAAAAFMFIGTRVGVIMSILSLMCITVFYILDSFNLVQFNAHAVSLTLSYRYFNLILILSVLTLMIYVLVRGNKKLQDVIQLSKEQKVREEIARDFHDQIGNKLASLRHLAELVTMNKTPAERQLILARIDANAKEVYDNFRDFIWTLDVKSDRLQELFMYLRDFADDCFKFSNINLYINSSPDVLPEIVMSGSFSKEIVPLFKEALTNVYKHARAKNIYLTFTFFKNTLTITLEDDGVGIDSSIIKNGHGLENMKYRAEKTGGTLNIASEANKGTKIEYALVVVSQ